MAATTDKRMTAMCEMFNSHGTPERRIYRFTYDGICAGIIRTIDGDSYPCECDCHAAQ